MVNQGTVWRENTQAVRRNLPEQRQNGRGAQPLQQVPTCQGGTAVTDAAGRTTDAAAPPGSLPIATDCVRVGGDGSVGQFAIYVSRVSAYTCQ